AQVGDDPEHDVVVRVREGVAENPAVDIILRRELADAADRLLPLPGIGSGQSVQPLPGQQTTHRTPSAAGPEFTPRSGCRGRGRCRSAAATPTSAPPSPGRPATPCTRCTPPTDPAPPPPRSPATPTGRPPPSGRTPPPRRTRSPRSP